VFTVTLQLLLIAGTISGGASPHGFLPLLAFCR